MFGVPGCPSVVQFAQGQSSHVVLDAVDVLLATQEVFCNDEFLSQLAVSMRNCQSECPRFG